MFGEKTLILMIDTSMYDPHDSNKFTVCYNKFDNNNDELLVIREKQLEFINQTIEEHRSENIQNLIIVGHHPITAIKIKKSNILIEPFQPFLNVLLSMPREGFNPKYYYLCADLHSYQIGNIDITDTTNNKTIGITQYVAGTGGTKLDPLFLDQEPIQNVISTNNEGKFMSDENYSNYNVKYTMTSSQIDASTRGYSHGFLECSLLERDNLEFEFIRVDGQRIRENGTNIGGGKRKHKYFMNIIKTLKKRLSKIKSKRKARPKKRVRTQKKTQKRKVIRTMRK
jgi:hypothetical protein